VLQKESFQFMIREGTEDEKEFVYNFGCLSAAIERICHIIEIGDLAFYLISEPWQSHWNLLAFGEGWNKPMPMWEESLATFQYNRLVQTKRITDVSILQYKLRVLRATKDDDIDALR
jgi:hypothetical protein